MTPNGRRAWRRAAKKLRCKMGRRWRSQEEWVYGKRWSELVPDLASHRGHISGPWFKRHGFQSLDQESSSRHYIGLWGTVNGDTIGFVEAARPFTARSLVGMTMGARKRAVRKAQAAVLVLLKGQPADPVKFTLLRRLLYRIGERLRPCPGCPQCTDNPSRIVRGLARTMQLRLEFRRCNTTGNFGYLVMLHRPGPAWSPICGYGTMRADGIRSLYSVILNQVAEEFPFQCCDGSGVLTARKQPTKAKRPE